MDETPIRQPNPFSCLLTIVISILGVGLLIIFFLGIMAGIVIASGI